MHPHIERHRGAIRDLCREYGVLRLKLFGSAATDAFDPERSDADFLVTYPADYDFGPWLARFQALEEALAAALGRDVDLVMPWALRNRWFNREAAKTRTVIYEAANDADVARSCRYIEEDTAGARSAAARAAKNRQRVGPATGWGVLLVLTYEPDSPAAHAAEISFW